MSQLSNPNLSGARALSRHTSNYFLEWSLRPWWRAILFLMLIIASGVWLAAVAARAAQSSYMGDTVSITDIQKALRHDPDNPDLVHRLGLVYTYNQSDINLSQSVKYLREAVALNPRRWEFWSDLGTACDFVGDTSCSDEAFERSWVLNPMTPAMQWTLGNHYLLTNRPEKAFPFFRRLLDLNQDYLGPTFRLCLRATHDPQQIYAEVIPQGKDGFDRFAFLDFLASTADYESAMKIWGQMISGPDRLPNLSLVKPFLDFLIDHNQIQDAGTVWSDLQRAGAIPPAPNPQAANLLYDGDLEGPPLNAGFDWRVSDSSDLVFDFSDTSAYKGSKCLRIDFPVGRNADYDLLSQVVQVKPNTPYQLTAYVRSERLTSDSGPRLRVVEMGCGSCVPRTSDPTQGSTPWHPIDVSFVAQPQTQAVRISFWRPRDHAALGDITGTVWLDDITLRAVDTPGPDLNHERTR